MGITTPCSSRCYKEFLAALAENQAHVDDIVKDPTACAPVLEDPPQKVALTSGAVKECGLFGVTDGVEDVNDSSSCLDKTRVS